MGDETLWTPGPWAVHPHFAYVVPAAHVSRPIGGAEDAERDFADYAQEICALHHPDRHRPESEVSANASLIAAAPDMAELLQWIALFADMRSKDDSKVFARVNRGALRTIRDKAKAALARARGEPL